jgi:hypothetical protein
MKLTGAVILVSRGTKVLQAAPAAYPWRSATTLDEGTEVETSELPAKRPSLLLGGVFGYVVMTLIGVVVCWVLAVRLGDFDNQRVFTLLCCIGAANAMAGYQVTAWRRKRLSVDEPSDQWQQFVGSWTFKLLAALVIVGSFIVSFGESLLFDLTYGAPWLQNR